MQAVEGFAAAAADRAEMDTMTARQAEARRAAAEATAEAAVTADSWAEFFAATEGCEEFAAEAMEATR